MDAVVLLSGGLDSTVVLAKALEEGKAVFALSFDYGQRHRVELEKAAAIASHYGIPHKTIHLSVDWAKSSLLGDGTPVKGRTKKEIEVGGVPTTYVPMRNTLFIAYAASLAESLGAKEIFFGANIHDKCGYPDTTPRYIEIYAKLLQEASRGKISLSAPLANLTKQEIAAEGKRLQAPIELTHSCYDPVEGVACGACDACTLRKQIFSIS